MNASSLLSIKSTIKKQEAIKTQCSHILSNLNNMNLSVDNEKYLREKIETIQDVAAQLDLSMEALLR